MALTGCVAEENDGRQFANNPRSTTPAPLPSPPAFAPSDGSGLPTVATPAAPPPATPIDPNALLEARGAPSRIYFRTGDELWTLKAEDGAARRVLAPEPGRRIVDHGPSPNGDGVAVLTLGEDDAASVVVLDGEGREVGRSDDLARAFDADGLVARVVDWSPQGDRLLVAFAPGGVVALSADGTGEPLVLFGPEQARAAGEAAWSPTGEAFAYLGPSDPAGSASLFLARTAPVPAAPMPLFDATGSGRTVGEVAWSPDGREILFTLVAVEGGPNTGGDLWRIGVDGTGRRVVVGAAAVGFPGARVASLALAPDGDALVYTVVVPSLDGPRFNSLWLKERAASARSLQLAVPPDEAVVELWWTDAGLVFRTVPAGDLAAGVESGAFSIYRAGAPGTDPVRLYDAGAAAPATPGGGDGSPVPPSSPSASPRAA